jgi:hypothetical protein
LIDRLWLLNDRHQGSKAHKSTQKRAKQTT